MTTLHLPRWGLIAAVAGLPVAMGLAAFLLMPPLYSLWCTLTGTAMSPNNPAVAAAPLQPTGRFVEVFFEARVHDALPVRFWADEVSVQTEVGREAWNTYRLENTGPEPLNIRPIHLVSPTQATPHFGMRVCFCFNDFTIQPGEVLEFPIAFTFAPELDPRTTTVSVCYSLFAIRPDAPRSEEQLRIQRLVEGAGGVVSPGFRRLNEAEIEAMRASEARP